ncbi:MAG: site-2 protease family protein [Candidatus Moranbacteria bacterium]|jgi:Zn-dependent protease|nr:site-2 protease family protein [Candidatus Moranbacteria bacterium]
MDIFFQVAILIFSVVIHEVSHGLAAFWLGDPTAKYAGRLTLNPIKHLDPWGSFIIPFFLAITNAGIIFGWAKPVPYNPFNLRNQKYGPALVGLAGPLSNALLALLAGAVLKTLLILGVPDDLIVYNILSLVILINILLLVFNLLPIPPLDGSKLLFAFLPISEHTKIMLERYGIVFLFAFLYIFSDFLYLILAYVVRLFSEFIVGVNLMNFL